MFSPDCVLCAAAALIAEGKVTPEVDGELRKSFFHDDCVNGREQGGLLPVYELLITGAWPEAAADRDELCRHFGCSAHVLYQWRRDVLYCSLVAIQAHRLNSHIAPA